jgi:hypothetical protein
MVVVGRPSYRIDSRTIKGGSQVSSLIVSFGESSNHCILGIIIFLGSCLAFHFVSLGAFDLHCDKLKLIENGFCMHLICVFGVGDFAGYDLGRSSSIS